MRDEPSLRRQWLLLKALSSRHLGLTVRETAADLGVTAQDDPPRPGPLPRPRLPAGGGRRRVRPQDLADQGGGEPAPPELQLRRGRRPLPRPPPARTAGGHPVLGGRPARLPEGPGRAGPVGPGLPRPLRRDLPPDPLRRRRLLERAELIDALQVAVEDVKVVRLLYRSEQSPQPAYRDVHPCGLIYHRGALYLIAFAPERGQGQALQGRPGRGGRGPRDARAAAPGLRPGGAPGLVVRGLPERRRRSPRSGSGSRPRRLVTSLSRGGTTASG